MLKSLVDLLLNRGLILFLFTTLLFCMSPLSTSPLIDEAHPSRLAETHMLLERAMGQQGWISGWDQRFQCGYPVGIYQYQTGPLLIAGLTALTSLPLALSYKIILYLGCLFAVFMVWRLLLGWVSRGVALAATLALFLGGGFIEQMAQGFWNCAISLGFLALFFDWLSRNDRLDTRQYPRLTLLYAMIIMTHQYAAIAAGVLMLGLLPAFLRCGGLKTLAWWIAIPIGAALTTLVYVYPILETKHWLMSAEDSMIPSLDSLVNSFVHLANLEFVQKLLTGQGIVATLKALTTTWPNLAAGVLALSLIVHWRAGRLNTRQKRLSVGLVIALAVFAMINLKLVSLVPIEHIREAASQIVSHRFKIFSDFCLFLLAALALHLWNGLYLTSATDRICKLRARLTPRAITTGIVIVLSLTTALTWYRLASNHRYDTFADIPHLQKNLLDTWQWFRSADRGPYRVIYESTYQNPLVEDTNESQALRQSTLTALGALYSGMPQASGVYNAIMPMHHYTRTSHQRLMGMRFEDLDPKVVFHHLQSSNIGYFVTCTDLYQEFFNAAPAMEIQARFGPFTIYRNRQAPGNWAWAEGNETVDFRFDPQNDAHMRASFKNAAAGNRLHVRVAWHPYWRATLDGKPLALQADPDGMIEAYIDKTGPVVVDYLFSSKKLPAPVLIINAFFLAGLIIAAGWKRFRQSIRQRKNQA